MLPILFYNTFLMFIFMMFFNCALVQPLRCTRTHTAMMIRTYIFNHHRRQSYYYHTWNASLSRSRKQRYVEFAYLYGDSRVSLRLGKNRSPNHADRTYYRGTFRYLSEAIFIKIRFVQSKDFSYKWTDLTKWEEQRLCIYSFICYL